MIDSKSKIGDFGASGEEGKKGNISIPDNSSSSTVFKEQISSNNLFKYKPTLHDLLDYNKFGYNTHITGKPGEILEATGCNTTTETGRIQGSEKIEATTSTDYSTETLSETSKYTRPFSSTSFFGIHKLASSDEEFESLDTLRLKTFSWPSDMESTFMPSPFLVPWKIYYDGTNRWLGIGPVQIPFMRQFITDFDGDEKGIIEGVVNDKINMQFISTTMLNFDESFDVGASGTVFKDFNSIPKGGKITGMKLKFWGAGTGVSRIKVSLDRVDSYDAVTSVASTIVPSTTTTIADVGSPIGSLKVEWSEDGTFTDTKFFRMSGWYTNSISTSEVELDGVQSSFPLLYAVVQSYAGDTFDDIYGYWAINHVRIDPPEVAGLNVEITMYYNNGVTEDWHAQTVVGGIALGKNLLEIGQIDASGGLNEITTDPTLESDFNTPAYGVRFEKVWEIEGNITLDIEINSISFGEINDGTTHVKSCTGLGHVTNAIGNTSTNVIYRGSGDDKELDILIEDVRYRDSSYYEMTKNTSVDSTIYKIHRLSSRYMLTFVQSNFFIDSAAISFFGIYDIITNRHYSPQNFPEYIDYLPTSLSDELSEVNVISDLGENFSFSIVLNDSTIFYFNIARVDSFNGGRLYKDSYLRQTKVMNMFIIDDGKIINEDADLNFFNSFDGTLSKHGKYMLRREIGCYNGNIDFIYKRNAKDTSTSFGSGGSVFSYSKYFLNEGVGTIEEPVPFATNIIFFPIVVPVISTSFTSGDSFDITYPAGINSSSDIGEITYYFKLLMMYDFTSKAIMKYDGESLYGGAGMLPLGGTVCLIKTPSVSTDTKTYNVLSEKAVDLIGVSYLSNIGSVGYKPINVNNKSFSFIRSNLYESSNYKLIARENKPLFDRYGDIRSSGNIIAVSGSEIDSSTQVSTSFYSIDRNSFANYIVSIPDKIISNIVHFAKGIVFACTNGIYLISQNSYDKVFSFSGEYENAVIRAIDGKDFVIYVYTTQGTDGQDYLCTDAGGTAYPCTDDDYPTITRTENYKIFRINKFLHISELETDESLEDYNIIASSNSLTDDIPMIEVGNNTVKVLSFETGLSSPTIKFRPIEFVTNDDKVFRLDKFYFYTYGHGELTLQIGNDIAFEFDNSSSKLDINTNNDSRYSVTSLDVGPIEMNYKSIEMTWDSTLKIDRIRVAGTYIER